jgi:hypothetical protein
VKPKNQEQSTFSSLVGFDVFSCFPDSSSLWHVWQNRVRRHSGAQFVVPILQSNFYAEDLADPILDGLHVARSELSLPIDLLDRSGKIFSWKRIHSDSDRVAHLD